ncbi:hypothetical protein ACN2CC_03095 [Mesorhizobium muleiense]|uniref:hypothetical protein n=1 Tax=Mesorhizobium muleiense TaxID=1004279 RepID=UPI003AFB7258
MSATPQLGLSGSEQAFLAAARRFPQKELAIRRLMTHSEPFRDMCEELAEPEVALPKVPQTPPDLRRARTIEWQEVVEQLVAEVAATLHESEGRRS